MLFDGRKIGTLNTMRRGGKGYLSSVPKGRKDESCATCNRHEFRFKQENKGKKEKKNPLQWVGRKSGAKDPPWKGKKTNSARSGGDFFIFGGKRKGGVFGNLGFVQTDQRRTPNSYSDGEEKGKDQEAHFSGRGKRGKVRSGKRLRNRQLRKEASPLYLVYRHSLGGKRPSFREKGWSQRHAGGGRKGLLLTGLSYRKGEKRERSCT